MPRLPGYKHTEATKIKMSLWHLGKTFSAETRAKMSVAKKGKATWSKGTKGVAKANSGSFTKGHRWTGEIESRRLSNANPRKGENHPSWKGENASYRSIHEWVQKYNGTPSLCIKCEKTEGKFEWANISHMYKRDLDDWMRLCPACHRKYDMEYRREVRAQCKPE